MLAVRSLDPCDGHFIKPKDSERVIILSDRPPTAAPSCSIYASVFESDSDDYSDCEDESSSIASNKTSFHRRPITLYLSLPSRDTGRNVISSLTLALSRERERVALARNIAHHQDDDRLLLTQSVEEISSVSETSKVSDDDEPTGERAELDVNKAADKTFVTQEPTRLNQFLRIIKRAIPTPAQPKQEQQASTGSSGSGSNGNEEEEDPCLMFFKNGQEKNISITPKRKQQQQQVTPPTIAIPLSSALTSIQHSSPFPIALTKNQADQLRLQQNINIPLSIGRVNNLNQITRAGPLGAPGFDATTYLEKDEDWVCSACSTANSKVVFSCWHCKRSKGAWCEQVIPEVDGPIGFLVEAL